MIGLFPSVRQSLGVAALAVLAAACTQSGKSPARDAAMESAPDAVADVVPDVADVPAGVADVSLTKDVVIRPVYDSALDSSFDSAFDEPRDVQASEALSMLPILEDNIIFGDTFKDGRTDGWVSADPGAGSVLDTDWSIIVGESGPVYCQGSLDDESWHISRAGGSLAGDQVVEAIVRADDFYAATSQYMVAVFARYDAESDSGYLLALRGDGSAILRKRTAGTTASWNAGIALGIVPGAWYTLHIEVIGSTVTAFVDGKLIMTVTDPSPIASGTLALGTYGATMEVQRAVVASP